MAKIKVKVKDNETYWAPIREFMDHMHKQGGHVSPVYYHDYLFDKLKPILNEMSDYDKKEFAARLTGKDYYYDI